MMFPRPLWMALAMMIAAGGLRAGEPIEETLYLQSGGHLTGRSLSLEDGQVRWELGPERELLIPIDWIDRLEIGPIPPPPSAAEEHEPSADPLATVDDHFPLLTFVQDVSGDTLDAFQYWSRRLQIGGQFLNGNTQTDMLDVITEFERGTPTHLRQVDVGGQWGRNQGKQTANRWFVNGNFDRPVRDDSQWIIFVTGKNEYNAFQNLDYRGTVSSGGGYKFFFEPKKRLIVRFGPAFTVEVFHEPVQHRQTPDFFGELELRWPVRSRLQVEEKIRVQPSLLDTELVRVFSTSGLVWDLDEKDRWKLRLGLQYTYNSQPNTGRLPSDYISTLSLVYLRK